MNRKPERGRALIVEDNHVARTLLRGLLRKHEFEVEAEATTAAQVLDLAQRLKPGLVCLDIMLPDGDGLEILQLLKADLPDMRVLMISGAADAERVREALSLGADGFIVKPYSEGKLAEALDRLFPSRSPA